MKIKIFLFSIIAILSACAVKKETQTTEKPKTISSANNSDKTAPVETKSIDGSFFIKNSVRYVQITLNKKTGEQFKGWKLLKKNKSNKWIEESGLYQGDTITKKYENYSGGYQTYAVRELNKNNQRGEISDSITILCGGEFMQRVYAKWRFVKEDASLVLDWKYDSLKYPELIGFQVFRGSNMLADENTVKANQRSYKVKGIDYGKHKFHVIAVSKFGLKSEPVPVSAFIRRNWVE